MSFIQPMFHLRLKPRPPTSGGRVTKGHAVDSSAIISTLGLTEKAIWLSSRRNSMASRFSCPPYLLGVQAPPWRS